jgi:DNA replication protein DnaC
MTSPCSPWTPHRPACFQVISERYDCRRSTVITTNRLFKDWPQVFPDPLNAQTIAERLTERGEHFVLEKSYRTQR